MQSVQMNDAAVAAKGDVLLFVHADTRIPADSVHLARQTLVWPPDDRTASTALTALTARFA